MNSGPHSPHQQPLSIPSQHEPSHNTPYRRTLGHHTGAQLRQGNAWRGIRTHTHTQAGRLTHPEADTTPPLTSSRLGLSPACCAGGCFDPLWDGRTLRPRRCASPLSLPCSLSSPLGVPCSSEVIEPLPYGLGGMWDEGGGDPRGVWVACSRQGPVVMDANRGAWCSYLCNGAVFLSTLKRPFSGVGDMLSSVTR